MSRWKISLVLCICTYLVGLFCVSAQSKTFNENDISSRLLPAYAVASSADLLNSTCGKELQDFRNAVDHRILWSLKMLDSSGGPKPGFIYGNNKWLGSRSQCQDTMNPITMDKLIGRRSNNISDILPDSQEKLSPFKVNYFVAHFKHNSTFQYHVELPNEDLITLGLCLPASCSINDLSFILNRVFYDRTLFIGELYSANFKLIEVKDLKDDHQWLFSGGIILIGFVLILTWCLMIVATIYDIFVYQKYLKAKNNLRICDESNAMNEKIQIQETLEKTYSNERSIPEEMEMKDSFSYRENKIEQMLMCFSVYTNTRIIFNTKLQRDSLPIIHGLKFMSMIWVIVVHTFFYLKDYADNELWVWRLNEEFVLQPISNPFFVVDTYFFLSGFLLTYVYLKNTRSQKKTNYIMKLNEFLLSVMIRFIRITPAYMMILGIVLLNSSWHDRISQFYTDEKPQETCAKYWWRNLLYINNLFSRQTMCMSWSWYLSNDMQFFIIGAFLLTLSSIYFYTAVVILGALLIGSTVITGYMSYVYEYVPIFEEQYRLLDILYDPPWTRIGPYIVGIITAYIITKLNGKLILRRRTVILCWCLSIICNVSVLFGLYERDISVLTASFYVALSRTVWGIGLAWLLIACCTNHAGVIYQLLSFKGWIPYSRLTYCAYLVNPFVISSIGLHSESSFHLDILLAVSICLGNCLISFSCAYALSLMSETPYILLTRMLIQSRNKRK